MNMKLASILTASIIVTTSVVVIALVNFAGDGPLGPADDLTKGELDLSVTIGETSVTNRTRLSAEALITNVGSDGVAILVQPGPYLVLYDMNGEVVRSEVPWDGRSPDGDGAEDVARQLHDIAIREEDVKVLGPGEELRFTPAVALEYYEVENGQTYEVQCLHYSREWSGLDTPYWIGRLESNRVTISVS